MARFKLLQNVLPPLHKSLPLQRASGHLQSSLSRCTSPQQGGHCNTLACTASALTLQKTNNTNSAAANVLAAMHFHCMVTAEVLTAMHYYYIVAAKGPHCHALPLCCHCKGTVLAPCQLLIALYYSYSIHYISFSYFHTWHVRYTLLPSTDSSSFLRLAANFLMRCKTLIEGAAKISPCCTLSLECAAQIPAHCKSHLNCSAKVLALQKCRLCSAKALCVRNMVLQMFYISQKFGSQGCLHSAKRSHCSCSNSLQNVMLCWQAL